MSMIQRSTRMWIHCLNKLDEQDALCAKQPVYRKWERLEQDFELVLSNKAEVRCSSPCMIFSIFLYMQLKIITSSKSFKISSMYYIDISFELKLYAGFSFLLKG